LTVSQQVLLYLLALVFTLGGLHVGLGLRRKTVPTVEFTALGAGASVLLGWLVLGPTLWSQFRQSPWVGLAWTVLLGLGFFAVGAVLAVAWLGAVRGLPLVRRWLRRPPVPQPRPRGRRSSPP